MASRTIVIFGLLALFALINTGDAVECYKCSACEADDVKANAVESCDGSCYIVDNMKNSWDRGCGASDYCKQHEGHNMPCSVCNENLCNSSAIFGGSGLIASLAFAILRFFH